MTRGRIYALTIALVIVGAIGFATLSGGQDGMHKNIGGPGFDKSSTPSATRAG